MNNLFQFINRASLLIIVSFMVTFLSCTKIDRPEEIPSFIYIDNINLVDNPTFTEGSLSNKIVDAWVYVDDKLIGAFELPCTVPVLAWGKQTIRVKAGIYLNGVKTTRVYYPFYSEYSVERELVADSIITINPVVQYNDDCEIAWKEDFETGGVTIEKAISSDTNIFKTNDVQEVFEGNYSGKVVLTDSLPTFLGVTINEYVLPQAGANVFLELDYKNTASIIIGVYANKATQVLQQEVAGIFPSDEWKKIYINLTPTVSREANALTFKIFIGAILPSGESEATILLDNIKLIHYQ